MRPRFRGRITHSATVLMHEDFLDEERIAAAKIALITTSARASSGSDVAWATKVTNNNTELRMNWFGCTHHQRAIEAP